MSATSFANVGTTDGIEVWRIENLAAVPYPKKEYGKFHTGDSYIVLRTIKFKNSTARWNIHFWLGKETSQDEAGAAAIYSVELDDSLGGEPIQYREVQDHESDLFLSYFEAGIRYLPGGIASGFRHVEKGSVEKRLFQVKGKKNVRVREVPAELASMNRGDCFILDIATEIFVYMGKESERTERMKAINAANQVRDQDHSGRSQIVIIDPFDSEEDAVPFFKALGGGSPSEVPDALSGGSDEEFESKAPGTIALYKVSDASGNMDIKKIAEGTFGKSMLESSDCFILDSGRSGIFVWIGRKSTKAEKVQAAKSAEKFLLQKNYPRFTKVHRVIDRGEPAAFKEYFSEWPENDS